MTTRQLLETMFKMLAFTFFIYAVHNSFSASSYFFMDFHDIQVAKELMLFTSLSLVLAPLIVGVLLFFFSSFMTEKILPKDDESRLLINISAYELQVVLLFIVAVTVALLNISPLISFSLEYFLADDNGVSVLYYKSKIIGSAIALLVALAFAFGAKTIVGWIRYMRYWQDKKLDE